MSLREDDRTRRRVSDIGKCALALCVCVFAGGISAQPASHGQGTFSDLLEQGFALHRESRFAEAIPLLQRARQLQPNDYFANLLLGIDLIRTGKPQEALPRLEQASRIRPQEDFPEGYLGEANATLGRYAQAALHYRTAVTRSHEGEGALEAWAGFALERFHEIGEMLRASNEGIKAARRLEAASKSAEQQRCSDSIPTLEQQMASSGPEHLTGAGADTAYRLSVCYAVEAGKVEAKLATGGEDPAAVRALRGDVLLRLKGDAQGAEEEYRQAIAVRPRDPGLLERLAEAQFAAGDGNGAKQSAEAALALDAHRRGALRTLSTQAMVNREYEKALPWLRQLEAESPNDRTVQVQLGRALAQMDRPADALKHLAPALAAGYPDERGALHALEARMLRQVGRNAEAAQAAAEARRLSDEFQTRTEQTSGGNRDANE